MQEKIKGISVDNGGSMKKVKLKIDLTKTWEMKIDIND